MPSYDYVCLDCAKRFEVFKKTYKEFNEIKCPACGSGQIHKKISSPNLDKESMKVK